ncbi:4-amino-4-deoxy-L-arabinose transferase [Prosthecobacter debontii]|uniref:4-amino-4-deoxy-L-arabinose transferase n=1 Tax=Prosthecobacter debontii TaxID=48467 RepID=A0A1T4YXG0_9BACT|nr:glycosyltransferase family 39 protein [Prosthecobacter debontii]SKB06464.1 4-amino-4-deoxy-L-arabinose transferase [Prosthecobacter debontii]
MSLGSRALPHWLILLVVTLALYLPGTGTIPLTDRDEPRFARATVEMMERGTWLVPYFNGEYRFDKPPLTYWWMRLHHELGGINEGMARLHSVVAVWLTAWIIASLGTRLHDRRAGLLSGIVWLTTLQVLVHGRLCVADMPLLLCLTLMGRALVELLWLSPEPKRPWGRWFWVLYIALGMGFLAKGPLAWLVPAVALGLARWWGREKLPWRHLQCLSGLALALLIVAAWGIPALIETHGLFWKVGMGEHVVKRGTEVLNGRRFIPLIYYPLTSLISLFPWVGLAWPVWRFTRSRWRPVTAFLLGWLAAPYVIFSFYATQLPHYVMPAFPAAALLVGAWLASTRETFGEGFRLPRLHLVLVVLLGLIGLGLAGVSRTASGLLSPVLLWAGILFVVLAFAGARLPHWVVQPRVWIGPTLALMMFGFTLERLAHSLREGNATLQAQAALDSATDDIAATACLGWDYTEPSLVFYTGRTWEFTGKLERVERFLNEHPQACVVALSQEWTLEGWLKARWSGSTTVLPTRDASAKVEALLIRHPGLQVKKVSGLNAARMSWVQLQVLVQPPKPVTP